VREQHLQRNKAGCTRLAQRAADILLDVREHMHGRWHRAPYSLVKNLAKLERCALPVAHMHAC
jgi:hypothetical protein